MRWNFLNAEFNTVKTQNKTSPNDSDLHLYFICQFHAVCAHSVSNHQMKPRGDFLYDCCLCSGETNGGIFERNGSFDGDWDASGGKRKSAARTLQPAKSPSRYRRLFIAHRLEPFERRPCDREQRYSPLARSTRRFTNTPSTERWNSWNDREMIKWPVRDNCRVVQRSSRRCWALNWPEMRFRQRFFFSYFRKLVHVRFSHLVYAAKIFH